MERAWIITILCFALVVTITQCKVVQPPAGDVKVPAEKPKEGNDKVVIQEESAGSREADLIIQFGSWLRYHQEEQQKTHSSESTLNLGSGCDCSFQVFCTRDSDCKSRSLDAGGIQENPNCKMDCCGARCD